MISQEGLLLLSIVLAIQDSDQVSFNAGSHNHNMLKLLATKNKTGWSKQQKIKQDGQAIKNLTFTENLI